MLRYNNPFIGRSLRYVIALMLFGILVPIILAATQPFLALGSILLALLITFGWDTLMFQFSKYKAASITKENIRGMIPAIMMRSEWKGFLVMTDSYILFVPQMREITFVTKWKDVLSFDVEAGYVELLLQQANEKRTVHFIVAFPAKTREELKRYTKEARLEVEI